MGAHSEFMNGSARNRVTYTLAPLPRPSHSGLLTPLDFSVFIKVMNSSQVFGGVTPYLVKSALL